METTRAHSCDGSTRTSPHTAGAMEADLLRLVAGPAPPEPRIRRVGRNALPCRPRIRRGRTRLTPARRGCTPLRLVGSGTRRDGGCAEGGGVACSTRCGAVPRISQPWVRLSGGNVPETGPAMRRSVTAPSPGRSQLAARAGDISGARRLARPLLALADDLLARGLLELTYAIALGQPERAWVTAADVAKRHTFGMRAGHTPACVGIARSHDRPSPRLRRDGLVARTGRGAR